MGTPNNPGKFDCDKAQLPDEPGFKLLARDLDAPYTIRMWVGERITRLSSTMDNEKLMKEMEMCMEALQCANDMIAWRKENLNIWKTSTVFPPPQK